VPPDHRSIFDAVLDALVEPVIVTDGGGVVTFANAIAAQCFGADKDVGAPIGRHLERLRIRTPSGNELAPERHPIPLALVTREAVIGAELSIESEHGAGVWVLNTVPLHVGDRIGGTVSVFHDITSAARLERELADHAARLETVVNLVNEGVFIIAPDGSLLFTNARGQRLLGLPLRASAEARARQLEIVSPDGRPIPTEAFPSMRALRGETVSEMDFVLKTPGGERRRIRSSAHPLRHPDGTIFGAMVTWRDITEEIRAREEMEKAREGAEEANRLKDQFIAALSHELRTPLQPILGWTEVLRRHGHLDAVTTRAVEAIHRNIRQQVRLVDDLLDLSRILHGKFALRFEAFDLRDQVRTAVEAFEEPAALKRIQLTASLPSVPLPMWGDGARLQQVTSNLIANALKFTPAGGRVNVRLAAAGDRARLEIEDTGEGIPPADLPVIFEAFRQGSQSRRRGGLGIGLDLVRRLTELHGGTVRVASEGPGRGACFSIELPLSPTRPARAGRDADAQGRLEQRSVLIIEDNDDTRDVLRFMLEVEGARVETAAAGEAGVRAADTFQPEIILCDIGLPDIDGMEVARRIRSHPDLARVRLIALTGYGQTEDVRQAVDAGFDAHLTKPINLDQLLALLTGAASGDRS
jgi:PAS domain S-box-containing protein